MTSPTLHSTSDSLVDYLRRPISEQRDLPLFRGGSRLVGVGHICCMDQGRFPDKIFAFLEIIDHTIRDHCQGCGSKILEAQIQPCTPCPGTKVEALDCSFELR